MQGESSHACTTEPFAARVGPRAMRMLIRAHENAARGHIAFSHFGDAAAILSARGLVHKRWHASISQGSCICTSYTFKVYALAITLLRHAHAHMHALHNVHMRVPYGTESLPKTSLADAALHGCSLTRRSNMA